MPPNTTTIWLDLLCPDVFFNIARRLDTSPPWSSRFPHRPIYALALASSSPTAAFTKVLKNTIHIYRADLFNVALQTYLTSTFLPHLKVLIFDRELPNIDHTPQLLKALLKAPNLSDLSIPAKLDLLPLLPLAKNLHHLSLDFLDPLPHSLLLQTFQSISAPHLTLRFDHISLPPLLPFEFRCAQCPFTQYPYAAQDGTRALAQACTSLTHLNLYGHAVMHRLFAWTFASHCPALTSVSLDFQATTFCPIDPIPVETPPIETLPAHVTSLSVNAGCTHLPSFTPLANRMVEIGSIDLASCFFNFETPPPALLARFKRLRKLGMCFRPSSTDFLVPMLQASPQLESLVLTQDNESEVPMVSLGQGQFFEAVHSLPKLQELRVRGLGVPIEELGETLRWLGDRLRWLELPVRGQLQPEWLFVMEVLKMVGEWNRGLRGLELEGLKGLGCSTSRGVLSVFEMLQHGQVAMRLVKALGNGDQPLMNSSELERMVEAEVRVLRVRSAGRGHGEV